MSNVTVGKNNLIAAAVLLAIVFFGAGFFVAKQFGGAAVPNGIQFATGGNGQRLGGQAARMGGARNAMGGFVNGELVKKDAASFSIKQRDGSMKLVLITSSTKAMKMSEGALGDFVTGQQIMVTGSANSDGSITAQMVQIRPDDLLGGPGAIPGGPPQAGQSQVK